jgi:hypothetical protein
MMAGRIQGWSAFFFLCAIASSQILSPPRALATNGEIGIFFDTGGNNCLGSIPCGQTGTVYLYAYLDGESESGITGVEYSVGIGSDGNSDPGWAFEEQFAPASVILGAGAFSPPDTRDFTPRRNRGRGVNIAFSECNRGDGGKLFLESVHITNVGCGSEPLLLVVLSHDTPSNQYFFCPLFTLCNEPEFTKVCVGKTLTTCHSPEPPYPPNATCSTSGRAVINPGQNDLLVPCRPTPVEPTTWTAVKGMYRR